MKRSGKFTRSGIFPGPAPPSAPTDKGSQEPPLERIKTCSCPPYPSTLPSLDTKPVTHQYTTRWLSILTCPVSEGRLKAAFGYWSEIKAKKLRPASMSHRKSSWWYLPLDRSHDDDWTSYMLKSGTHRVERHPGVRVDLVRQVACLPDMQSYLATRSYARPPT